MVEASRSQAAARGGGRTAALGSAPELSAELKRLIIETLMLEDVSAEQIDDDAPLFVEGLGLDSIDALELALALEERYGVQLADDPDQNRQVFASVASLGAYVGEHRQK